MRRHPISWYKGWKITLHSTKFQCQDGSTRFASTALLEPMASQQDNSRPSMIHMDESFTSSAEANSDALDRAKREIFASSRSQPLGNDGKCGDETNDLEDHESISRLAARFEIVFDGKRYRYRQYRYDRFEDALRYARADHSKSGFQPDDAFTPQWEPRYCPSDEESREMRRLGVTYINGRFSFSVFCYDRLADALAYAGAATQLNPHNGKRPDDLGEADLPAAPTGASPRGY